MLGWGVHAEYVTFVFLSRLRARKIGSGTGDDSSIDGIVGQIRHGQPGIMSTTSNRNLTALSLQVQPDINEQLLRGL